MGRTNRLVNWIIDDRIISMVVLVNFAVVYALGWPDIERPTQSILKTIDYVCLGYFVLEISLKVSTLGWPKFWSSSMNRFDLVVIALAAPALIAPMFGAHMNGAIVLLRTGRFLRLLRAARFIPNAQHLWAGIGRALKASVGLVLALSLYNLVLGLLSCQMFHDISPKLFGDPLASTYTIFRVFTIEGWHEVPAALIQNIPQGSVMVTFVRGFFVFVVVTGGLLGLSLTNAVLVDEMVMDNTDPVEKNWTLSRKKSIRSQFKI